MCSNDLFKVDTNYSTLMRDALQVMIMLFYMLVAVHYNIRDSLVAVHVKFKGRV